MKRCDAPLVSIVTPSYNQAQYLPICLRSVSMQSYEHLEHIVIDGGSNDGSVEILEEFVANDKRLKFSSGPDGGQGDAVNKGFSQATGDIIAWINSDDYYFDENIFEHVVSLFNSYPDIDVIYGGMVYVDPHDTPLHVRIPPDFNYPKLTRIAYIGNTNAFYRKRVIHRHIIDPSLHYVIDHEYMLRITRDFKAMRTKNILACFRVHPKAKTQTFSKNRKNKERIRRDKYHNISHGFRERVLNYRDRISYRLNLLFIDFLYLKKMKNNPPYKIFLHNMRKYEKGIIS